jgi:general secretion pathway protein K
VSADAFLRTLDVSSNRANAGARTHRLDGPQVCSKLRCYGPPATGYGLRPEGISRGARRAQRGVALITAVLIVALATILAVSVGFKGYLDQRRTATTFALDQGFEVALGGEAWASDALRRDALQSPKTDDFTEEWATPIPPIPIEGGEFEGVLEDMQGRFNLNSLVMFEGGSYKVEPLALKRFSRLLEILELEEKWASIIADWIDSDADAGFPSGAEDSSYTSLTPA